MEKLKITSEIPVKESYDVIVCGAGVAGIAAALCAKRKGKSVLLVEKSTILGGLATLGLINLFVTMDNGRGKLIVKGMCQEFVELAKKYSYDTIRPEWKDGEPKGPCTVGYSSRYSPQIFALTFNEILYKEGVKLYFDCIASEPVMDGKHCRGVILQSKSGREFYGAKVVVDATGDADILALAGVPTVTGGNYYTYVSHLVSLESCKKAIDTGNIANVMIHHHGGRATLEGYNQPADKKLYTGTNVEDVSEYLILNQLDCLEGIKSTDRFTRDIVTMPGMAQFRTTRHIAGDYSVKMEDVYRHFEDSVAVSNDFSHKDLLFEVPLRAMTKKGFDNLITCGRCVDATGYAWDVLRVIPPAIVTGQAAGAAASNAIDEGCAIYDVDIKKLQAMLVSDGADVHFDDALVPEGETAKLEKSDLEGHI